MATEQTGITDDDTSPVARLRRAELTAAHTEAAEAAATAREAQARAEERRLLIDELRRQLAAAQASEAPVAADAKGSWLSRRR
ncbi:hypothetical protein ACQP2P_21545 [Dactylosporangium sp. CA-139114]|uniref:hypothetical protein n=1 Tax=Dactylosporangium sp. CA-139114 TaxID=3239931 RepID=UPI003D992146